MRLSIASSVVVLALSVGCASHTRGGPQFPPASKLDELAAAPAPGTEDFAKDISDVERWPLSGGGRDRVDGAPYSGTGPWDAMLADVVGAAGGRVVATEGLHCVARELAAFGLSNEGQPSQDLVDFVAARCGAASVGIQAAVDVQPIDAAMTDDEAAKEMRASLSGELGSWSRLPDSDIGLAAVRANGKLSLALVAGERSATIEPTPMVPGPDGLVHVRGRLGFSAVDVHALVNQGRFDVTECARDPGVALPDFSFACRPSPDDASAWIEVYGEPAGRLLFRAVCDLLVFPSGKPENVYRRPALLGSVGAGASDSEAFLAGLNAVRDAAKLGRVHDVKAESATATKLAPRYFAALRGANPAPAELIALGLMAGWQVDAPLRYGKFTSAWTAHAADGRRTIASALARPMGRSVLLDPEVTLVAIGRAELGKNGAAGTIIASYASLNAESQAVRTQKVLLHLAKERAAEKVAAPKKLGALDAAAANAVLDVEALHKSPKKALENFMQASVMQLRRGVRGFVVEAESLDDVKLPPDLLRQPDVEVSVAVAWVRDPGEAWGRYVVMVVEVEGVPA